MKFLCTVEDVLESAGGVPVVLLKCSRRRIYNNNHLAEQEFVIGRYRPDGKNFDALLAGYYQGKELFFAGKIKAGFTPALRASLWKVSSKLSRSRNVRL